MSTYSQTLNELRQNNWRSLSSIKTRNLQIGDFASKKLQEQGKLFALAGQTGAELIDKYSEKIKQDQENEIRVDFILNQMEDWSGSDEANAASTTLLDGKAKQDGVSNFLTQVRKDGAPSHAIHEADNRTGKYNRIYHQLATGSLANRYDGYMSNAMLNNTDIFEADIDGQRVKIQVNNPNKSFKEAIATRNYLRKEYFNIHDLNSYTKEFLALSTERGGSGFYQTILASDKKAYTALEKQYDIKESLDKQVFTQAYYQETKSSDAFVQMYNTLANGVNDKGKPIGNDGAWKFIREDILEPGINSGQVGLDDLITIANTELNGKLIGETWPQYFSVQEGKEGTMVRKFFEAQDNIANDENKQGLVRATTAGNNLIDAIDNNQITSDLNYSKAIKEIQKVDKGGLYNYDKIFRAWEGRNESPELTQDAVDILTAKSNAGTLITDLVASESDAVKNDPFIKQILAEEKKLLDRPDVKQYLTDIKTQFQSEASSIGLRPDEFKNSSAAKAYELNRDYFVQQNKDGNPAALALTNTDSWFNSNGGDTEEDRDNFIPGNTLGLFAKDSEGNYPNIQAQIIGTQEGPANSYIVSKKKQEQVAIINDARIKNEFNGSYKEAFSAIDPATNKAAYYIREEETLFKGNVDYNTLLDQTGMTPTWVMEHARRAGMSVGQFLNLRQTAHGKPELKKEFLEYLGQDDVSNLQAGMLNRLNGHTVDGLFRPEEISGTIAKNSNAINSVSTYTYGDDILGITAADTFNLPVDDDGMITVTGDQLDAVKTVSNIPTAIGASLSSTFATDFKPGGEQDFTDMMSNVPKENILQMFDDPEFATNMYALTGDLTHLPLEDSLAGSELDVANKSKLNQMLEELWKPREPEEESPITEEPNPTYDYTVPEGVDTNPEATNPLLQQ